MILKKTKNAFFLSKHNICNVLLSLFALLALWHCKADDGQGGTYCINCITTFPDSAYLEIKLTINSENPKVPINIYEGLYTGDLVPIVTDTVSENKYKILVPTNVTYSVEAIYKAGNRKIYAVDGGEFNRQEQTGCETTCWQLIGGSYDLRLKNY